MKRQRLPSLILLSSALAVATANFCNDRAQAQPSRAQGQIVTPGSGIVGSGGNASRARTNVKLLVPAGGLGSVAPPSPTGAAGPEELPPISGVYYANTPASLRWLVYMGWSRNRPTAAIPTLQPEIQLAGRGRLPLSKPLTLPTQ
jgi:hypothetical protein